MDDIKRQVQESCGAVARAGGCGCGGGPETAIDPEAVGYAAADLAAAPEGSNMGLGCGNPLALADLKLGETVLDLGSGGASTASSRPTRLARRDTSSAWT